MLVHPERIDVRAMRGLFVGHGFGIVGAHDEIAGGNEVHAGRGGGW